VSNRGMNPAVPPVIGLAVYVVTVAIAVVRESDEPAEQGLAQWAVTLVIAAVGAGIAFAVSRRAVNRSPEAMARSAAILGVVAVVSILAFWAGLPCVFGATAVGLGLASSPAGGRPRTVGIVGVVLGALALVAGSLIMLSGA
jgi:Kef-type K+ transport system membrane component KefB